MENNLRKELKYAKGITLITLIITIIVLLILAGISLSAIFNSDGIFNRAEDAGKKYEVASILEVIEFAKTNLRLDDKKITATNIKQELIDNGSFKENEIEIIPHEDKGYETIKIREAEANIEIKKVTLYFEKSGYWNDYNYINAYVWRTDTYQHYVDWPGVPAEKVEGLDNVYSYTVPEIFEKNSMIIFNGRMNETDTDAGMQTIDLPMSSDGHIFVLNDSNSYEIYTATDNPHKLFYCAWTEDSAPPIVSDMNGINCKDAISNGYVKETKCLKNTTETWHYWHFTLTDMLSASDIIGKTVYFRFYYLPWEEDGTINDDTLIWPSPTWTFEGGNKIYFITNNEQKIGGYSNGNWVLYKDYLNNLGIKPPLTP